MEFAIESDFIHWATGGVGVYAASPTDSSRDFL